MYIYMCICMLAILCMVAVYCFLFYLQCSNEEISVAICLAWLKTNKLNYMVYAN